MSLDRNRILSELGSVMNQLQSADCGCMGKLFNQGGQGGMGHGGMGQGGMGQGGMGHGGMGQGGMGQGGMGQGYMGQGGLGQGGMGQGGMGQGAMGNPLPTCGGCRRGWCRGHGMPSAGEPYQANTNMNMNTPCMGHCNPPKLYADTYNYLNNNLMQPVVQEVYNDLKSITPANTVMNSPMANQMGLAQGNTGNAGNPGMAQNKDMTGGNMNKMQNMAGMGAGNMGNQMQSMPGMGAANMNSMPAQQGQQQMNNMGGMGPEIAKMILGEGGVKPSNPQNMPVQGGQLTGTMLIDAPQSPHGQVGVTPLNQTAGQMNPTMNQGQFGNANTPNVGTFNQNPTLQYMSQPGSTANAPNNPIQGNFVQNPGNAQMGNMANPAAQQMAAPNQRTYGQHTQGVAKFNEMFPGVMQGGDLGFDPMAIAIQMNPANQQKAAMDTMQKLMNGSPMNRAGAAQAAAPANVAQPQSTPMSQVQYANQQGAPPVQNINQEMVPGQQPVDSSNAGAMPTQPNPMQQQQVYTAVTGSPQQQMYQQSSQPPAQQNANIVDPNTGAPVVPPDNEATGEPNAQMQQPPADYTAPQSATPAMQQMIKDPIFPADTSRNRPFHYSKPQKRYDYNTLGQPVQMFPAQMFHPPEPSLPQTLSPQPVEHPSRLRTDQMKYSNVKSTVSKTSIMGNGPVGRSTSKSQLQHIYNQYKGSQSYTQQNLRTPVQAPTHSDGKLNVAQSNAVQQQRLPVEKVGGDTIANNQMNNQIPNKVEQVMGQVGDVPASNKPHGDMELPKATSGIPERQAKLRNGLQDVLYTSYPTSAAWSFHGANEYRPVSVGYRFRQLK